MLRYKTPRPRSKKNYVKRQVSTTPAYPDEAPFTGWVRGREASTYEERFYRELIKEPRIDTIHFERIFGIVPYHINLDFLFWSGRIGYAVQLDGLFVHKTAQARAHDRRQDVRLIDEHLKYENIMDVSRISSSHIEKPQTTANTLKHLLAGRVFRPWETG